MINNQVEQIISYSFLALNRLTQTITPAGQGSPVTTEYAYDNANRMTSAGGATYTWDNNGNLLSDGNKTYRYDELNHLVGVTGGGDTYSYAYDGQGNRVSQTVNGVSTNYVLDLSTGLPQVLADNTHTYLYGLGLEGQDEGGDFDYFGKDGLGSVRQVIRGDANGEVTQATSYTPYGEVLWTIGDGNTSYGFTGEMTDANGLVNLRARYYDPGMGRFLNKDTWTGDANQPMSYNGWEYVYGNPVNGTDPSGKIPDCSHSSFWNLQCQDSSIDDRDLTDWLYREMMHNIKDPRLLKIQKANTKSQIWMGLGTCAIGAGIIPEPLSLAGIIGGGVVVIGGGTLGGGTAILLFKPLVQDHGPWDFKHKIKLDLGEGITLGNQKNIEYSVPGNIHYGFVGSAAGYADDILYAGAGVAEIFDPSHVKNAGKDYTPYNGDILHAFGDDPQDYYADVFGVHLYKIFEREGLTLSRFRTELNQFSSGFAKYEPRTLPVGPDVAADRPYPVGYFKP
jgi:RHS repeat-associated protein